MMTTTTTPPTDTPGDDTERRGEAEHDATATTSDFDEPHAEVDALRAQADALVRGETIDKPNALGIANLFHSAETLVLREVHRRHRALERLGHEVDVLRMSSQHAATLVDVHVFKQSLDATRAELGELHATVDRLRQEVAQRPGSKR